MSKLGTLGWRIRLAGLAYGLVSLPLSCATPHWTTSEPALRHHTADTALEPLATAAGVDTVWDDGDGSSYSAKENLIRLSVRHNRPGDVIGLATYAHELGHRYCSRGGGLYHERAGRTPAKGVAIVAILLCAALYFVKPIPRRWRIAAIFTAIGLAVALDASRIASEASASIFGMQQIAPLLNGSDLSVAALHLLYCLGTYVSEAAFTTFGCALQLLGEWRDGNLASGGAS